VRIALLIAGTSQPSNSEMLAEAFMEGMAQPESTITTLHVRDLQIDPFHLDTYAPTFQPEPDFRRVQAAIQNAHGIVIATPVWNFSVPAHLKNLIDRCGGFGLDASHSKGTLKGVPFFLIFTGGAPLAAWTGMLRSTTGHVAAALEYFGASHIGTHFEPKCVRGRGEFGLVVDQRPDSLARLRQHGHAFAEIVSAYERTGVPPVRHRVRSRFRRWGEAVLKKIG
jgi:NAD(P)H-dependent FMN reductase